MKKIPTLFKRIYEGNKIIALQNEVDPSLRWVMSGEGIATVKIDGACCAMINGVFYRRYDAKKGKPIPAGAIKCQEEADPVTGHLPCWVQVDWDNPADKWFVEAKITADLPFDVSDGTYEAVGPHFQSNPYKLGRDTLIKHGEQVIEVERSFEGIREYLSAHNIEGIVFWKDGEPQCKIKRSDFGLKWPNKGVRPKKIRGFWYTKTHIVKHDPPLLVKFANCTDRIYFTEEESKDRTLYSMAKYPTKVKAEDLPYSFIYGRFFKHWGYLDVTRITDIVYKPNLWINHLFRDDSLYIKCGGKLHEYEMKDGCGFPDNCDVIADGWDIVEVLAYLKTYTDFDYKPILDQIEDKVFLYQEKHPNEIDCITTAQFWSYWKRFCHKAAEYK